MPLDAVGNARVAERVVVPIFVPFK